MLILMTQALLVLMVVVKMMATAARSLSGFQVSQAGSARPRSTPTARSRHRTRPGGAAVYTHRCWKSHTNVNMFECFLSTRYRVLVLVYAAEAAEAWGHEDGLADRKALVRRLASRDSGSSLYFSCMNGQMQEGSEDSCRERMRNLTQTMTISHQQDHIPLSYAFAMPDCIW